MNYGELHTWAPLKAFGRIIAVFWSVEDAERLRQECDGLHVGGPQSYVISSSQTLRLLSDYSSIHAGPSNRSFKTLRLYRGEMTSLETPPPESKHLQVPAHTKNFLISPPGSPPVGWEHMEEEPPNAAALAADLMAALTRLQRQQEEDESVQQHGKQVQVLLDTERDQDLAREREQQRRATPGRTDSASSESLLVLLEDVDASLSPSRKGKRGCGSGGRSESGSGSDTPDEIIEILNPAHEMSSSRGWSPPHRQQRLPQTAMPPPGFGSITSVRATVESMRTAMPPLPPS